jgi:hypothetical protein
MSKSVLVRKGVVLNCFVQQIQTKGEYDPLDRCGALDNRDVRRLGDRSHGVVYFLEEIYWRL